MVGEEARDLFRSQDLLQEDLPGPLPADFRPEEVRFLFMDLFRDLFEEVPEEDFLFARTLY